MGLITKKRRAKGACPTGEELKRRLVEIAKLVNKPRANIPFVEAAFALLDDCNLLTEENVSILTSAESCLQIDRDLRFMRNPNEGALRRAIDYDYSTRGGDGEPRFYPPNKRLLKVNGKDYLISNDWYKDDSPCRNKSAFFRWICHEIGFNPNYDKDIKAAMEFPK